MVLHNNLSFDLLTYSIMQSFASYQTYIPIKQKERKMKKKNARVNFIYEYLVFIQTYITGFVYIYNLHFIYLNSPH